MASIHSTMLAMLHRHIAYLVIACGSGAAACISDSDRPSDAVLERIENGIVVVENPGVHLADSLVWWIDETPVARIGQVEGPEELLIGRLAGMLRCPDGSILIGDAIAHEVRVFGASGRFVRSIGRKGEGPGEFAWMSRVLAFRGDSLVVLDGEGSRAHVFDAALNFIRRFRPQLRETRAAPPVTSHSLVAFFADGQPLMSDFLNVCGPRRRDGFCEDSAAFFRTDDEGAATARFGRFVYARQQTASVRPGLLTGWREPHPQAIWAVHGQRFYYGDAKRFEIRVYRSDGELERIIRLAIERPRYTREQVFPPLPRSSSGDPRADEARRVLAEMYRSASLPNTLPAFSDLLVDVSGNIWVREYTPPVVQRMRPARWLIFDPRGKLRWAVRSNALTRSFRPYLPHGPQIGDDYVLTSQRDEFGVERVLLLRLHKRS